MRIDKPRQHVYQIWEDSRPLSKPKSSAAEAFRAADLGTQTMPICWIHVPEDPSQILCLMAYLANEHARLCTAYEAKGNPKSMDLRKVSNMLFAILKLHEATTIYPE